MHKAMRHVRAVRAARYASMKDLYDS